MTTRPRRTISKRGLLATATGAAVLLAAAPAGASTSSPPIAEGIAASGYWDVVAGSGGAGAQVAFGCDATATLGALQTGLDQCGLYVNGVLRATAPAVTVPGSVATTASTAAIPLFGITSVQVCWQAYAAFVTGDTLMTSGCTTAGLL